MVELAGETGAWSANPGTNHARAGNRNEAGAYLEELQKRAANRYVSPMGIAAIHAALGDREQAFAWLRQAYEQHETGLIYLNTFPLYDSLRANPRTQEILRDMGMVK